MPTRTAPRHRAQSAPQTVPDAAAHRAAVHRAARGASGPRRRIVLAAGTSCLVVAMLGGMVGADARTARVGTASDARVLSAPARAAAIASLRVQVSAKATWAFDAPDFTVVLDPPPTTDPRPEAGARSAGESVAFPDTAIGNTVLEIAARYIGSPYLYGGSTPDGFDCSGFTQYVFAQVGISLSHGSDGQGTAGTRIPAAEAQPGDLMWWPGHVAIYAGGNTQIDSSRPGTTVQFRTIHRSNPTFIRLG